jgi:hypothetical protein
VGLEEHGTAELRLNGEDGGVEALEVTGLQDAGVFGGKSEEVVGLGEGCGQGLFDQEVEAGAEQGRGDGVVVNRGHGYGGRVNVKIGGKQFIGCGKDGDAVPGGVIGGAGWVRLNGCDEGDTFAGRFKLAVDAEVILAKGAGSGHGNAEDGLAHYASAPFPSTALRQRL